MSGVGPLQSVRKDLHSSGQRLFACRMVLLDALKRASSMKAGDLPMFEKCRPAVKTHKRPDCNNHRATSSECHSVNRGNYDPCIEPARVYFSETYKLTWDEFLEFNQNALPVCGFLR